MSNYKVFIDGVWKDICDCNNFQIFDKDGIWRKIDPSVNTVKYFNGTAWEKITCCNLFDLEILTEINGTATISMVSGTPSYHYKINLAGTETIFIEGDTSSNPFTVTDLALETDYEVTVTDINGCTKVSSFKIGQSSFKFLADYIVLSYEFTDGQDLDTRTGMITPDVGQTTTDYEQYLGYAGTNQWPVSSPSPYLVWGLDNTGLGFESILVDLNQFKLQYPSTTEIVVDCRAHWFGSKGNNPIKISAVLYKGTPNCLIKEQPYNNTNSNLLLGPYNPILNNKELYSFRPNIGFSYTSPPIIANPPTDFKDVTSVEKVITTRYSTAQGKNPERVCTLTYDLITGEGVFNI